MRDRVVGADGDEGVQHLVVDMLRHLLPSLRARQQLEFVGKVAQPEMIERRAILRRRGIERDARAGVADLGHQLFLRGGRCDQGLHAGLEVGQRPSGPGRALAHRGQHDLGDVGGRAHRMEPDALGHFARHPAHQRIHRRDMDRDVGMFDRPRIEQRHHQVDGVVLALDVERRAGLPVRPDRAHGLHILAHPQAGGRPREAIAPLDMSLHLRAQPQREPPAAELGQGPGAHRRDGRAAREGDRHRRADLQGLRRLCRQRHQDEGIVLGLLDHEPAIADLFQQLRGGPDRLEIECDLRRAQPGIDLAQRGEGFQSHGVTPPSPKRRARAGACRPGPASGRPASRPGGARRALRTPASRRPSWSSAA